MISRWPVRVNGQLSKGHESEIDCLNGSKAASFETVSKEKERRYLFKKDPQGSLLEINSNVNP